MRVFPKKYPFPVQLRQYLPKKSEEMGYNCTFIAISSEEIPFLPKKFYGPDMKKATFSRTSLQSKSVKSSPFRVGVPLAWRQSKVEGNRLFFLVFFSGKFDKLVLNGEFDLAIVYADILRHDDFNELCRHFHPVFGSSSRKSCIISGVTSPRW